MSPARGACCLHSCPAQGEGAQDFPPAGPENQWVGPQGELGPFLNHLPTAGNRMTGASSSQQNLAVSCHETGARGG